MKLNQHGNPCSCDNVDCPRHGKCDECRAAHEKAGKPNACDRKKMEESK